MFDQHLTADSQRAGIFTGERGQEYVGKMHEKSTDRLLGRIKEPADGRKNEFLSSILLYYSTSL